MHSIRHAAGGGCDALCHALPSSCRHRGTEEATTHPERPFDTSTWEGPPGGPAPLGVCGVLGWWFGGPTILPPSPYVTLPAPRPAVTHTPHHVRAARPSRGEGIDGKAGDRPVSGTPPHHFPSTPTTHPATIARPYIPALPAKDGYGEHHHLHTLTPTRVPGGI